MTKICKDTAIKLFGRTIPLHEAHINPAPSVEESVKVPLKETPRTQSIQENQENQAHSKPDPNPNPNPQDSPTKPESNNGSESGSDKTLKKPDKIIPCPRCNSMDTKFCYYNNYNVNQPRHFCKNCQRYWTAGGTMRNVPVGAGRRKNNNKHINVNQFRQVMLTSSSPERFLGQQQAVPVCNSGTGTVLKFGTDVPLCESMQNNLSIKEEKNNINNNNSDMNNNNNMDEQQSSCNSNSNEPGLLLNSNNNMGPTRQCYNPHGFMWGPAIPMPFIPASFWPGPWWTGFTNVIPSSPNSSSSSGSPTLGKHARDTDLCDLNVKSEKRNNSNNGNLWAPKTVRLVDPEEAAKSSILATLGIKKDDRGIFGNLTGKEISGKCDAGPVLNANPAALSRFQSFQERT